MLQLLRFVTELIVGLASGRTEFFWNKKSQVTPRPSGRPPSIGRDAAGGDRAEAASRALEGHTTFLPLGDSRTHEVRGFRCISVEVRSGH